MWQEPNDNHEIELLPTTSYEPRLEFDLDRQYQYRILRYSRQYLLTESSILAGRVKVTVQKLKQSELKRLPPTRKSTDPVDFSSSLVDRAVRRADEQFARIMSFVYHSG